MRTERLYFYLGVLGLVLSFIFLALGAYGSVISIADAGLAGGLCFIAFFVPAIFFLGYWRRSSILERQLRNLADVLRGYRQIALAEVAEKTGAAPRDIEILVAACIGRGYVKGRIDKDRGVFILDEEGRQGAS